MTTFEFERLGGHPAADFINTLDERISNVPIERLDSYAALVDFTRQTALIDTPAASRLLDKVKATTAQQVLTDARDFREALFALVQAAIRHEETNIEALSWVEDCIRSAAAERRLTLMDSGFVWVWRDPNAAARPLWELALAAENLLTTSDLRRLKQCAADDCGVIFVDDSRAGARRWCSMATCGNRYKVQKFRAARRDEE